MLSRSFSLCSQSKASVFRPTHRLMPGSYSPWILDRTFPVDSKLELRQPRCHRCVHVRSCESPQVARHVAFPECFESRTGADSLVVIDATTMDCVSCRSALACIISEVQRCHSAAAVRSFFLPPINRCNAVVVLAIQAGSNVSSGRAGKRRHPAAAIESFLGAVTRMEPKLELRQPQAPPMRPCQIV